ncbi:MAG TPA: hypothetical protein VMD99_13530 [Terriglobales bacterium]|nr:hypothetical protein [Terriglobales bacterium]
MAYEIIRGAFHVVGANLDLAQARDSDSCCFHVHCLDLIVLTSLADKSRERRHIGLQENEHSYKTR